MGTKRGRRAFKFKLAGLDCSSSALAAGAQLRQGGGSNFQLSPNFLLRDAQAAFHCLYGTLSIVSFTDCPEALFGGFSVVTDCRPDQVQIV